MAIYIKKDFASPNGPILLLSAKGSTTASIAEANGVKDFSGNGNHGTASGGIGVTNDSEMGSCFDFTDLSAVQSINGAFQNPSNSVTVSIRYKRTGSIAQRNQLLIGDANSSNVCRLSIYITTRTDPNLVQVAIYTNNEVILSCNINTEYGMVTSDPHLYTSTYDASTSSLCLYVDDKLVASTTVAAQSFTISKFMLGYPTSSYRPVGLVSEARIYPRALSAAEVKYLYNGFQPSISMGQNTPAKLMFGSSEVKHLYYNGNLLYTKSASYEYETEDADNIKHIQNNSDLWGIEKLRGTNGDYIVACGIDKIIKVYKGTSGNLKFSTSMVNSSALKYDICQGKTDNIIYLAEHISSSSSSYLRKLRYTGNGFEEVANIASGSGHGLDYDFANDLIIAADYYGGKIRIFRDDGDTLSAVSSIGAGRTYVSDVGVTSDGRYIYYTGYNNNYLGRYDTVTGTVNSSFKQLVTSGSGWQIMGFALSDDNKKIVFSHAAQSSIKVYDLEEGMVIYTLSNGDDTLCTRIRNLGNNKFIYVTIGSSVRKLVELDLSAVCSIPVQVGFKLHQLNSTSQRNTIEYVGSNSDYDSITYSNGTVNMGDWSDWINAHFTPVMLKSDGTVDYELSRDNLNYKADGVTPSDIANTSYDGNAMLQIKKFYISSSTTTEDGHTVFTFKLSDIKIDNSYTCWGFVNSSNVEQPYAYYGLFHGYIDGNSKLRSMSGITLSNYTHTSTFSTMSTAAKANGTGWDISNYALENALGLVLMMIYKDVNPMFVNQDSSNNYRETSTAPYAVTGALAASGGFPWITTSMMQKALWIESYWRNAAVSNLAASVWTNGLGSLRNSNNSSGFGIYYKLKGPYDDYNTPANWIYMSNTVPYVYASGSHQIEDATIYDNMLFPLSKGDNAAGAAAGLSSSHYNRFYGGGDVNGSASSYHSTTVLYPVKTGMYRAMDKWAAPPHYMSYQAFGSDSGQTHKKNGSARLTYLKE